VVEEVNTIGKLVPILNTTFIVVVLKVDQPSYFDDFQPIVVCNSIYKIIAKIIAVMIKPYLSNVISPKQIIFLKGQLIHEAIGSA